MSKLTYEDLKLGEKAKEAFIEGMSIDEIMKTCPVYLNTRPFFAGLHMTDAIVAGVLGGINALLVGDTGTGKSQLLTDIKNHMFNDTKKRGGHSIFIRAHPDVDIYNEVFTQLNLKKATREQTDAIDALLFGVDEINRASEFGQNQFFGLGDGMMDHKGADFTIGKDGYHLCIATANIGNGQFGGTFKTDKALWNRMHLTIDFDLEKYQPTRDDRMLLDRLREANPNVKNTPTRDLSAKILAANKKIAEMSRTLSPEEVGVINFLRFGLNNCTKLKGAKGKMWPVHCQDCPQNKGQNAICSKIRAPCGERTFETIKKYASALTYVASLKNPDVDINAVDLMFKAFEVAGPYQAILNPMYLKTKYYDENPRMMADIVEILKNEFRKVEDFIVSSVDMAQRKEKEVARYFWGKNKKGEDVLGDYDELSNEKKKAFTPIEPFTDNGLLGFSWVKDMIQGEINYKR